MKNLRLAATVGEKPTSEPLVATWRQAARLSAAAESPRVAESQKIRKRVVELLAPTKKERYFTASFALFSCLLCVLCVSVVHGVSASMQVSTGPGGRCGNDCGKTDMRAAADAGLPTARGRRRVRRGSFQSRY